jgi:hypothetical protein
MALLLQNEIIMAAANGRQNVVQALIMTEVNINSVDKVWKRRRFVVWLRAVQFGATAPQDGWTALMHASVNGHTTVVRTLLAARAVIDKQNSVQSYQPASLV